MEGEFKKERNETYEVFKLPSRKQRTGESLEQFHSVHSGLAARCALGTLESRIVRNVFFVNMTNREARNELCRATKTPEEAYRFALSYERGDKYARTYVATTGGTGEASAPMAGGLQIKWEPVGVIRGGYRSSQGRGRGQPQGRGQFRGGGNVSERKCYNCDKPNFTRDYPNECATKRAMCNFCLKKWAFLRARAEQNEITGDASQWG